MTHTALNAQPRTHVVLLLVVLLALAARFLPGPRTIDDAFITFRYSRNIVEGQGFVYNPGERVLGTTTPLFTLLMAAISAVTGQQDYQWYAIAVSALADAATAALLFLLARRLTDSDGAGALLGALWAISPMSVTFAVGGMETSVNILWMVAAVWSSVNGRERQVGAFAALGLLTRIDALLWIAPLLAFQLAERWRAAAGRPLAERLPWRAWLVCALILAPWVIFSALYFGSPLPRSVTAKTLAYVMPPASALSRLIQAYATPFFEFDAFGSIGAMAGFVVYTTLSVIGVLYVARRLPRLLPFVIYPYLYLAAFSFANPLIFRWYLAPPMPAWMLAILAGCCALLIAIQSAAERRWVSQVGLGLLAVVWGSLSLNAWAMHPDHGPDRPAPRMAWHQQELYYQQIGAQLRDEYGVTPDTLVAAGDIGAVGYFSRAAIMDTVGLVTPEMARYYPVPPELIVPGQNYAIPPQIIADTQPRFLVAMEAAVRLGLERDPAFQSEYELVLEIPTDFYGTGMRLYQRVSR
jgi:MFS family permease